MGYESFVSGSARGKNIVQQLLDQGFQRDGQEVGSPQGWFTGVVVADGDTIAGIEDWRHCYDFGDLVQALHRIDGLQVVSFYREGEDNDDVEGYRYLDGRWYTMIRVEVYVQEAQAAVAEQAIEAAVAPFAPPGPAPSRGIKPGGPLAGLPTGPAGERGDPTAPGAARSAKGARMR